MENNPKLILKQARCKLCNDIITSRYNWDYQQCSCGAISIDGGLNDISWRRVSEEAFENLNVYDDAPFEVIRVSLFRGDRGKNFDKPLRYVPLCEMSNEWIENILRYNNSRNVYDRWSVFGQAELVYREEHGIFIEDEKEDINPEPRIITWISKQINKWQKAFTKSRE